MTTKQEWLTAALDCLLSKGDGNVKVESLARSLGVTKGSFYWHFKDRADLLRQIASVWEADQRAFLQGLQDAEYENPEARLEALFEFIATKDIRYDVAMRLWARRAKWVDGMIAEVDEIRLAYCESIFHELGFSGDAARLRAHLVYYYQVADQTISFREPDDLRRRLDGLRFELLIRPN